MFRFLRLMVVTGGAFLLLVGLFQDASWLHGVLSALLAAYLVYRALPGIRKDLRAVVGFARKSSGAAGKRAVYRGRGGTL